MVFSHAFAGAALTKLIEQNSNRKVFKKNKSIFYFVGIATAILPDLDILYLLMNHSVRHRELLSHSLLPYLLIALVIWIISQIKESEVLALIALLFFVGTTSHLLLDFLAGGISVLAPFTYKVYGFSVNLPAEPASWLAAYMRSKFMVMEFGVFLLYLWAIRNEKNLILNLLPLALFIISVIAILFLVVFVF